MIDAGELAEDEEIILANESVPDHSFARVEEQRYFREDSIMGRFHVSVKAEQ